MSRSHKCLISQTNWMDIEKRMPDGVLISLEMLYRAGNGVACGLDKIIVDQWSKNQYTFN